MIKLSTILLILVLLSCNSAKQATKKYESAKRKNIVTVATLARKDFPLITTRIDSVRGKDSIVIRTKTVPQYITIMDTVTVNGEIQYIERKVKANCNCADSTVYQPIYYTKLVKDSAESLVLQAQLKDANKATLKQESAKKTWRTVAFVFIGLFLLNLALKYLFKI